MHCGPFKTGIARMPRNSNQTLRRTLGFFRQGIPVLFIKNDVMFRSFDLSDDYFKLLDEDGGAKPGLAFGDDEVAAFERFATMLHELRHFHDALLCQPLFDKFLLQHKITWYALQLINRLARYLFTATCHRSHMGSRSQPCDSQKDASGCRRRPI